MAAQAEDVSRVHRHRRSPPRSGRIIEDKADRIKPAPSSGPVPATAWQDFWNAPNAIYVNDRHRTAHYRRIGDDLLPYLPGPEGVVLDYGCGEALAAARIAERVRHLYLHEAAPAVRQRLATRFAGLPAISVLDEDGLADLADNAIDLIVVVSVVQYLSRLRLKEALALWHRLLRPTGSLLIADVVPPHSSALSDAARALGFAAANGYFRAAVAGMVRLALSDYRRLRRAVGLARYDGEGFAAMLAAAGFAVHPLPRNIGPSPHRLAFLARLRADI
jgi:SAM-dependent methyltransferase